MEGWILEKKSRKRFWKRGGEALRRAVRSCAMDPTDGSGENRDPESPQTPEIAVNVR
jgi:hypothetical protein